MNYCFTFLTSTIVVFFLAFPANAQTLLERAKIEYENNNYELAINYLREETARHPSDGTAHFYLGKYLFEYCNAEAPISGCGQETSDEILEHLRKAAKLLNDNDLAIYLIGLEHGRRAIEHIRSFDTEGAIDELSKAESVGAFPEWLIEYAQNSLNSCERNGILFVTEEYEIFPLLFLQLVRQYRADVSIIPLPLLNTSWFNIMLKSGIGNVFTPVKTDLMIEDFMNLHLYPFTGQTISVEIPDKKRLAFKREELTLNLELNPDIVTDKGKFISPAMVMMAEIIRANAFERAVYFSVNIPPEIYFNRMTNRLQHCGIVYELLPFTVGTDIPDVNEEQTSAVLLDRDHYINIPSVQYMKLDGITNILHNYRAVLFKLCKHYWEKNNLDKARMVLLQMEEFIPEYYLPMPEDLRREMNQLIIK